MSPQATGQPAGHQADDEGFMARAVALARQGLGATAENPSVGCLIVKDGAVVGQARTADGGRPHAEAGALLIAGAKAQGATAYVTLEPCSHHGRTPPCSQALITAGVSRVVVACQDPDPRVAGTGLEQLRAAGIEVSVGCLSDAAQQSLQGFFYRQLRGWPLVTLKIASSLDGKIALANGQSQWITGSQARRHAHHLRAEADLIVTGAGTVLADNPRLTCRHDGLEARSPRRVVLDRSGRVASDARIFEEQDLAPTQHITGAAAEDFAALLRTWGTEGVNSVLIESGPGLATAFLQHALVDRLAWYLAPKIMGGDGRSALGALGLERMDQVASWQCLEERTLGSDRFFLLERPSSS